VSDKILDRIQGLINQANHPGTGPAEREAFLMKANQLKHKHKIDSVMLKMREAAKGAAEPKASVPIMDRIAWIDSDDPFKDVHQTVISAYATLTGVRLVTEYGFYNSKMALFGYPDDVAYLRMLWTGSYLTFSTKLFPKWELSTDEGTNIKNLAEAGIKWKEIWQKGRAAGSLAGVAEPPKDNGKMKRLYARACRDAGVERANLTQSNAKYRESYAAGFRNEIVERMWRMKLAQERAEADAGAGVGLVLRREATAIDDLVAATYPGGLGTGSIGRQSQVTDERAGRLGREAGASVDMTDGSNRVGGAERKAVGG